MVPRGAIFVFGFPSLIVGDEKRSMMAAALPSLPFEFPNRNIQMKIITISPRANFYFIGLPEASNRVLKNLLHLSLSLSLSVNTSFYFSSDFSLERIVEKENHVN